MIQKVPLTILAFLVFGCTSNSVQSEAFDLDNARKIIGEKTVQFTQAHITGDTAFLNSIFAQGAKIFPPGAELVTGAKAISVINAEYVSYGIKEFREEAFAFYGNEKYLIEEGNYTMVYGEDKITEEGKYLNVWKNENGEWKMYSNIWNTN